MKAAIIGGDKRMLFAAKAFSDDGCETAVAGFDSLESLCSIRVMSVQDAVQWADFSVLPIRPVAEGCLNCPYSAHRPVVDDFAVLSGGKPVFCGCADSLPASLRPQTFDYAAREEFAVRNAVLTAEGAIALLLREYEDSVCGADILVLGFGRIGKALSRRLNALGAHVTVAARKPSDRAWIVSEGMTAVDYSSEEIKSSQMIINTVPAPVLARKKIDLLRDDVFLVDLASAPGGMDFARIQERGLTCFHALGLPGKTAPKAAGRMIKETIIQMIKEENGGKENPGLCDDRLLLHL